MGAGIGGLATAALLARAGCDVTALEAHVYPGGCAGTFFHKGYRFDAGATIAGGFQPGGPHDRLARMLDIDWPVRPQEPSWVVHLPRRSVVFGQDREDLLQAFPHSAAFWTRQRELAAFGWKLGAGGLPWPPADGHEWTRLARTLWRHAPGGLRHAPFAFRSVADWMARDLPHEDREFRRLLDAQLLISAQSTSEEVNALWGATALDLPRQGTMQMEGGMGALAQSLSCRLQQLGGRLVLRQQVTRILVQEGLATGVVVRSGRRRRSGQRLPADFIVANVTPWNLARLLGDSAPGRLKREARTRKAGWGAFVLHLGLDQRNLPEGAADHHQVVTSLDGPLGEGNSLFISISPPWDGSRAPEGCRALTVSTHTRATDWQSLFQTDPAACEARKAEYVGRMLRHMERALPCFREGIRLQLAGTPLTWQYYTGRHMGLVGGFPVTSLLNARGPRSGLRNLRLVGDSVFPGQSTAGVVAGAMRVTRDVLRQLAL
ncbi:MAG: NAD(P)/FAD-dependent oxidoreductase [Anaerolineaceae bacterium]|nr:NAD(P)/FAD-dependent oxidoreductase [Anaerolineaceae bacterium]